MTSRFRVLLTGPLQQEGIEPDQFAQLFFYDHDQAADLRCIFNEQHDETFIREFTAFLHDNNPFIDIYKTAKERFQESEAPMRITLNAQMRLIVQEGADERRENLPIVSEVAAVIPDEYADRCYREIVLAERSNQGNARRFSSIHPHHAAYLPLAYPLLFPHGDHDFHRGLRLWDCQNQGRKNHSVEWRQYCRYILHQRDPQQHVPLHFGRLF